MTTRPKTVTEQEATLFRDPNFGTVTTLRADGSPHTTVVWLDWDGEHVVFNTEMSRAKPRNIEHDPRVSVAVFDPEQPYHYVSVSGRAELDEEGAVEHINELSRKYGGPQPYPTEGEDRVIVRVTPEHVTSSGFDG